MAMSRRTEKQQLQKNYELFLQETQQEEERLQREEDEFWAQKLVWEEFKAEEAEEEAKKDSQRLQMEAFDTDFFGCWPDFDPYIEEYL